MRSKKPGSESRKMASRGSRGATAASDPRRVSRRRWLKSAIGLVLAGAGAGAYAGWVEPTWVEVTRVDLPVPGLPPEWEGVRVVHLSDLHAGSSVPWDYLKAWVRKVPSLEPDLVAITGDVATHPDAHNSKAVASLLEGLSAPLGVVACLGNHEYGLTHVQPGAPPRAVVAELAKTPVRVLRNEALRLVRGGQELWIAGMDDLWACRCDPATAMAAVPAGAASLALCHNPDAADACAAAGSGAILAGHTHGGQVDLPLVGAPVLPVQNRRRYRGLYAVGNSWLYVNRGLGWILRVRLGCRPEVAVLTLRRAT